MPVCPKCGTVAASNFCPNCGTPLDGSQPGANTSGFTSPYSQVDPRQSQGSRSQVNPARPYQETSAQQGAGYANSPYPPQGEVPQYNDVTYHSGRYAQPGNETPRVSGDKYQSGGYQTRQEVSSRQGYPQSGAPQYTPRETSSRQAPGQFTPSQPSAVTGTGSDPKNYKLKWHKFLVFFWLWFIGLLDCVAGYTWIKLMEYNSDFGLLGFAMIAVGIFNIIVIFPLARYKKGAPRLLLIAMGAVAVLNVIVLIIELSLGTFDGSSIGSVIWQIAALFYTYRYYSSREDLFVR